MAMKLAPILEWMKLFFAKMATAGEVKSSHYTIYSKWIVYIYIQYSIPCLYIPLYPIISHEQFHELLVSPSEKSRFYDHPNPMKP
jgi:hypothetical protein